MLVRLGAGLFYSTLDLTKGYWQIPLSPLSKEPPSLNPEITEWDWANNEPEQMYNWVSGSMVVRESQPSQTPISPSSLDPPTRSLSPEY